MTRKRIIGLSIIVLCGISIIVLCGIGVSIYIQYDLSRFNESIKSPDVHPVKVAPPLDQSLDTPEKNDVDNPVNNRIDDTTNTEPSVKKPSETTQKPQETVEQDDPVAAAWARLDYLSENLHEWGQFSPRATELIEQLTSTWNTSSEYDPEIAMELLEELCTLEDPRSLKVFVSYIFEGRVWGRPMEDTFVTIGPPSVPLLIPYLDESSRGSDVAARVLGRIGEKHRDDLGGAVEFIILPKLEEIVMSDSDSYSRFDKLAAQEAITRLQKNGK